MEKNLENIHLKQNNNTNSVFHDNTEKLKFQNGYMHLKHAHISRKMC